jgi:hypothetical protein
VRSVQRRESQRPHLRIAIKLRDAELYKRGDLTSCTSRYTQQLRQRYKGEVGTHFWTNKARHIRRKRPSSCERRAGSSNRKFESKRATKLPLQPPVTSINLQFRSSFSLLFSSLLPSVRSSLSPEDECASSYPAFDRRYANTRHQSSQGTSFPLVTRLHLHAVQAS